MEPTDTTAPDYFHKVVDCQWACPAHTDVPEYIRLIAQGRFTDAYLVNRASNVFPGILGRVCDRPCEPACRRGRIEEKPVAICRLKRVAADHRDDITRSTAARAAKEERQAHRLHRRGAGLAHGGERSAAARLRGDDLRAVRGRGRPDAHQYSRRSACRPTCSTRRSATSSTWAPTLRLDTPVESMRDCSTRRSSTPCSSARGAPKGKELDLPGRHDSDRDAHRHRLARVGRLRAHREDRRARADHRRRQYRHGLLPHLAAPRRQGREGHGAQAAPVLQGLAVGARGRGSRRPSQIVVNRAPKHFVVENGELKGMMFEHLEYDIEDGEISATRVLGEEFYPCDDVILAIGQENAFPWIERDIGIEFDRWRRAQGRCGHLPVDPPGRVLRRRCRVRPQEHHLVGGARAPGRHLDAQILPGRAGRRAHAARGHA